MTGRFLCLCIKNLINLDMFTQRYIIAFLSCLSLIVLMANARSTAIINRSSSKLCGICLITMVGIIHDLNDSKPTILAKIDQECWAFSDKNMELYEACVSMTSRMYLKIVEKMEKRFDPNMLCRKIHACPKF